MGKSLQSESIRVWGVGKMLPILSDQATLLKTKAKRFFDIDEDAIALWKETISAAAYNDVLRYETLREAVCSVVESILADEGKTSPPPDQPARSSSAAQASHPSSQPQPAPPASMPSTSSTSASASDKEGEYARKLLDMSRRYASGSGRLPDDLRGIVKESFVEQFAFYEGVCNENKHKDGRKYQDPFWSNAGSFAFGKVLDRLRKIRSQVQASEDGTAAQGNCRTD
ncbi:unnamed protein product [Vitrella brassicaformis CCMP3155]|uniref:Uncharacterized protein n=1 Tax=Vitrella brassicaformis (strain CCMP3155) TaxID=1169540 RepID=A0A0G4G3H1_VITBC|nr:unnamed protein product [Vitrella brassicaformis CCMP3155]|eukprot:CEM22501.1 unnamed protein product [Vitrella brassicaformis CCMP3155]